MRGVWIKVPDGVLRRRVWSRVVRLRRGRYRGRRRGLQCPIFGTVTGTLRSNVFRSRHLPVVGGESKVYCITFRIPGSVSKQYSGWCLSWVSDLVTTHLYTPTLTVFLMVGPVTYPLGTFVLFMTLRYWHFSGRRTLRVDPLKSVVSGWSYSSVHLGWVVSVSRSRRTIEPPV